MLFSDLNLSEKTAAVKKSKPICVNFCNNVMIIIFGFFADVLSLPSHPSYWVFAVQAGKYLVFHQETGRW